MKPDDAWLDPTEFGDLAVVDDDAQPTRENVPTLRWKLTRADVEGPTFRIRVEHARRT